MVEDNFRYYIISKCRLQEAIKWHLVKYQDSFFSRLFNNEINDVLKTGSCLLENRETSV